MKVLNANMKQINFICLKCNKIGDNNNLDLKVLIKIFAII